MCVYLIETKAVHSSAFPALFYLMLVLSAILIRSTTWIYGGDQVYADSKHEVAEVVESLPMHKVAGPDEIDPEHLIYGGKLLVKHLSIILNAIMATGHIPPSFTHGLVLPIPKGHNKDLSNPSNYRGISLLSNISKVLERLVVLHL